ncbi:MAG TPA: SPOR domain-containing protein [bacterium (Candidatus Stahlbacteria)]|nr:SPOR domain-containing protein [Candidatus Stahlbacteria bacterium]
MVPLIFVVFVFKDSFLFCLGKETIDSIPLNMRVVDYQTDKDLYLLTEHEIIKLDTTLTIKALTPLPSRYFQISRGKRLILISTDELLILDKDSLTTRDAIALPKGDYRIIGQSDGKIYLLNKKIDTQGIETYSILKGRRIGSHTFYNLKGVWQGDRDFLIAEGKELNLYSKNLKKLRKIKDFSNSDKIFIYRDRLISIDGDTLRLYDFQGNKIRDLQLSRFEFQSGGDFLVGFKDKEVIIFSHPDYEPNRLRISKEIKEVYADDDLYLKIDNYYRLDWVNRKLIRLRTPVPVVTVSDSGYYLQVGAFTNPEYAKDLLNQLSARGIPAHSFDGKIRIGPFASRQDGIDFAKTTRLSNFWVVRDTKRPVTGLLIGKKRYLPIIGSDRLMIYNISDSLLTLSMTLTGQYSTYLNQDIDNDGRMELILMSEQGREIISAEADSLLIQKEE